MGWVDNNSKVNFKFSMGNFITDSNLKLVESAATETITYSDGQHLNGE